MTAAQDHNKRPKMSAKLVIGMVGYGTVGQGVVKLLRTNPNIEFRKIVVKSTNKTRDVPPPEGCLVTTCVEEILNDDQINCVVEVMGGTDLASKVVFGAITASKHVVTANKALIAQHMNQIQGMLSNAGDRVGFFYEAAVCGGIPIINVIKRGLAADDITELVGILNGTTNFMLCLMEKNGVSFDAALKEAQERGFAEADPSADILGWDCRAKLVILAKLLYGITIKESDVYLKGIVGISPIDFHYAKLVNRTIKLVGKCEKVVTKDGFVVRIWVSPALVPLTNPIARVEDATNIVELTSSNLESSWYTGPGAGRYPTANSIAADILELVSRMSNEPKGIALLPPAFPTPTASGQIDSDFEAEFFLRFTVRDGAGIIHNISGLLAENQISIFSILQVPIEDPQRVPFVVITDKCHVSQVRKVTDEIRSQMNTKFQFLVEEPIFLPYLC